MPYLINQIDSKITSFYKNIANDNDLQSKLDQLQSGIRNEIENQDDPYQTIDTIYENGFLGNIDNESNIRLININETYNMMVPAIWVLMFGYYTTFAYSNQSFQRLFGRSFVLSRSQKHVYISSFVWGCLCQSVNFRVYRFRQNRVYCQIYEQNSDYDFKQYLNQSVNEVWQYTVQRCNIAFKRNMK